MKQAYVKVEAEYAQGSHGETWVELEGGEHFMQRLSEDDFAAHVLAGFPSQLYMASADGELIAKGKTVTGFANCEEDFADNAVWNYNMLPRGTHIMPWRIEDRLKELGANFVQGGLWRGFAVRDGNLITGQQNFSGEETARLVVEALGLRIGLGICYDLRFPELFRTMGTLDLIVLPAAFTETTGQAHWELLLRARAVENQCYVLASAQGGRHPTGRVTHGNSMIIEPWGAVLARLDKGEGVVVAELDPARIAEVRASLPALRHRRL
jgi:hypothetical protein